jgi:hypothetical protein
MLVRDDRALVSFDGDSARLNHTVGVSEREVFKIKKQTSISWRRAVD